MFSVTRFTGADVAQQKQNTAEDRLRIIRAKAAASNKGFGANRSNFVSKETHANKKRQTQHQVAGKKRPRGGSNRDIIETKKAKPGKIGNKRLDQSKRFGGDKDESFRSVRDSEIQADSNERLYFELESEEQKLSPEKPDTSGAFGHNGGKTIHLQDAATFNEHKVWKAKLQRMRVNLSDIVKTTVEEDAKAWGLDPFLVKRLKSKGMAQFFPIQRQAVPGILGTEGFPTGGFGVDVCVSAPTGSGKTLVYVLPIVQTLLQRSIQRLRALVILPSRDLAIQVKNIFDYYTEGSKLKVGLAIGQSSFADEQADFVGPQSVDQSFGSVFMSGGDVASSKLSTAFGGCSMVDILVATPGRLIDHIEKTPGFTLQHLRFLVVDEADRLLSQSYQDWITKVYNAAYGQTKGHFITSPSTRTLVAGATTIRNRPHADPSTCEVGTIEVPFRRMLFSATLTRNPKKLASLGLLHPQYYFTTKDYLEEDDPEKSTVLTSTVEDSLAFLDKPKSGATFSTPAGLTELMHVCASGEKPLILLHLLKQFEGKQGIIFTSSLESTHRLYRLLQLYQPIKGHIVEYSSQLPQGMRTQMMKACREGRTKVLVCSDAMARGIDLHVEYVINYDMPTYVKTYIHRVGRTARAGREGTCITLLKKGQEKTFRDLLRKIDNNFVRIYPVERESLKSFVPRYVKCLSSLKDVLDQEASGELSAIAPITPLETVTVPAYSSSVINPKLDAIESSEESDSPKSRASEVSDQEGED